MKQPTMMNCKMIRIGFLLALFMLTTSISRASKPEEKDYVGYLFTYFTGNHISEEAVCFAVSTDGYSFYALNDNKPVLDSKVISSTGGVRDPHILRCDSTRKSSALPEACATRISCGAKTGKRSIWS